MHASAAPIPMPPTTSPLLHFHPLEPALADAASSLLRHGRSSSASTAALARRARELHALLLVSTPPSASASASPFLLNNLLSLYSRLGSLADARNLLAAMPRRTVVSYNTVLAAHSRHPRHAAYALHLFRHMAAAGLLPSAPTLCGALQAAAALRDVRAGACAHARGAGLGLSSGVVVQTALLGMYAGCGSPRDANRVFDEMCVRDVIAWNCIIHCNVRHGDVGCALRQFCCMVRSGLVPTESTFSTVLSGCGRAERWNQGRILHAWVVKSEIEPDVPLQNALLDMYSSCSDLETALCVFRRIETPDLVSWNTVIAGFSDVGNGEKAMEAFVRLKAASSDERLDPDEYTFASVISSAATLPAVQCGKPLHAEVIKGGLESSVFVGNTLINMYFMNEEPYSARALFNSLTEKDVIVWTEMVSGHSAVGDGELALKYFIGMLEEGHKVDSFSLSSALNSAADLAILKQGEMLHAEVVKAGYGRNICVCGSLVDMYGKNGALDSAHSVFCTLNKPDLKCWNSMIGAYGNHGSSEKAFKLFGEMVRDGMQPDRVTYISLLSACGHCGLVEKGRFYWFCMLTDGIVPGFKHYTCMVSLLSRAGLLQEALDLIRKSPFAKKCPELWRILLSCCVRDRDLSAGVYAAEQVLVQDPDDVSTHIMLSNLYASAGKWDVVAEIRKRIRGLMLEKEPGLSWIEIKDLVHVFSADDESHMHSDDCRNELLRMEGNMKLSKTREVELLSAI